MNQDVSDKPETAEIPASGADARAAVYINLAEKLDAEAQQQASVAARPTQADAMPVADDARPAA